MPSKKALLCIDMQNDFCLPDAPLCVQGAMQCLPNVIKAVELAREHEVPVIWVVREHHSSGVDVEKYRESLFKHGSGANVKGTPGADLVEGLTALPEDLTIVKPRFSAFFATNLDLVLRRLGVAEVAICGVQTPNCIRASAYDAVSLDYSVTVISDATASASSDVQEANLHDLRCIGVATPGVADYAAQLALSMTHAGR